MKPPQFELPQSSEVFNLAVQVADDPWRVDRERWAAAQRQKEAAEYAARMQLQLAQCPGWIGSDAPTSEQGRGVVVVEPALIVEALAWLKRRFHASETIDVDTTLHGIAVEVAPRQRSRSPLGGKRVKVKFGKVEQFTLPL